jgi:Putative adhesin
MDTMPILQSETARNPRFTRLLRWTTILTLAWLNHAESASAQFADQSHQTLAVAVTEPVTLDIEVARGEVQILYSRDGQVSIAGFAQASRGGLDSNFFKAVLTIQQSGNHIKIRDLSNPAYPEEGISVLYRIEVPYRTEVTSKVNRGRQTLSGIMGPVRVVTHKGDIKASYVSRGLQAEADTGNLDLEVIGERVEAKTGNGNISCTRLAQGITAETGDGDITLMVVGPSMATVKSGPGRIDAGGVRGTFVASTSGGDLHVKAVPHDDWQLNSASGNIRFELPPAAKFELDASTNSGEFQVNRDDIARPPSDVRHLHQQVNGGGRRIQAHTGSGKIVIG